MALRSGVDGLADGLYFLIGLSSLSLSLPMDNLLNISGRCIIVSLDDFRDPTNYIHWFGNCFRDHPYITYADLSRYPPPSSAYAEEQ